MSSWCNLRPRLVRRRFFVCSSRSRIPPPPPPPPPFPPPRRCVDGCDLRDELALHKAEPNACLSYAARAEDDHLGIVLRREGHLARACARSTELPSAGGGERGGGERGRERETEGWPGHTGGGATTRHATSHSSQNMNLCTRSFICSLPSLLLECSFSSVPSRVVSFLPSQS